VVVYQYDDHGFRTGGECRDSQGKLSAFDEGNAIWRASPNAQGRAREFRYYDAFGNPFGGSMGHVSVEMDYDERGHQKERRNFLANGQPGDDDEPPITRYEHDSRGLELRRSFFWGSGEPYIHRGCAARSYDYDSMRHLVRAQCLDADGKLALDSDETKIITYSYDARGFLAEMRYVNEAGKLQDNDEGFARVTAVTDALGVLRKRHFAAGGAEVSIGRYSAIWVRPPRAGGYFPAPSREVARQNIEQARRELLAGLPWSFAMERYADGRVTAVLPGDAGYMTLKNKFPVLAEALRDLKVGEYSEVVEIPYGFVVYQRTE
jgi:YD repeat-containing protein